MSFGCCRKILIPERSGYKDGPKPLCQQVIAYTILDINRTTRMNEKPMTMEQQRYLQDMAKSIQLNERKSGNSLYLETSHVDVD